ncbi:recombinase family protein [Myxococcota bacterium]
MGRTRAHLLKPHSSRQARDGAKGKAVNIKAIGIVRVSSRKQRDNNSPELQRRGIEEYIAGQDLKLVRIERIHESAAKADERGKFQAALERAKAQHVQHVVFWVRDRLTRNFTDHEKMEEDVRAGVFDLHFASERKRLHKDSPDVEWLGGEVTALTSKQYVRDLRRRAIESMEAKAEGGDYPTKAPFGYTNVKAIGPDGQVKDRGGTIGITEWIGPLVRRAYELRVHHSYTLQSIANTLRDEGLVPKRRAPTFNRARVEQLLKDPFYRGQFVWREVLYDGNHEPVLTPREWDSLQATFNKKQGRYRQKQRRSLFGDGFLDCEQCGCLITYEPKSKGAKVYHYYRCANGKRVHEKLTYAREDSIMNQFGAVPDDIYIHEALAEKINDALNETHNQIKAARKQEAQRFVRALEQLEGKEDELYDDLKAGTLDDNAYRRQLQRVRDERKRYAGLLERAHDELDDAYLFTAKRTLELAMKAKTLWDSASPQQRKRLLETVLSKRSLDGLTVCYDLKKPFKILAEMREDQEWRALSVRC